MDHKLERLTMVELLEKRALEHPEKRAFTFLADGELEKAYLTFGDLDYQARSIGALFQHRARHGERALLLYPSGLEFLTAFFGCLYAGLIAVPTYPPQTRTKRSLAKLQGIIASAQPSLILTSASLSSTVESLIAQEPGLQLAQLITTDTISDDLVAKWRYPPIDGNTLAFIQYTSGSTGMPKGVMLTHNNLAHNSASIYNYFENTPESCGVIWLPLYHDMGLIGGIVQAIYAGCQTIILPPTAFLQRPIRWLQAISKYRAITSAGPNSAYDLCVRKISPEQKAELDLSSWSVAFSGAETIRPETIDRFVEAFEPCGFRRGALCPCYGLAEATLLVSGRQKAAIPVVQPCKATALKHNQVVTVEAETSSMKNEDSRTLVGCGRAATGLKMIIVDPESCTQCLPDQIGEIWVSGLSVAQGYWRQPEETERTFKAYLLDTGEGPFLRTGDLGFLLDGELFITGRLKDLIIIRGLNHYPQDIELTVEQCHPALRPGCGAAFSVDAFSEERLVIVQEIERQYRDVNVNEVVEVIRQAIAENHDLQVYAVVLIKIGSIPKTSSGKLQRRACREMFLARNLDMVGEWTQHLEDSEIESSLPTEVPLTGTFSGGQIPQTVEAIQAWLSSQISTRLKFDPRDIDVEEPFAHYGMDSVQAVSLAADLETWLGTRLSPTVVYDFPNIEALSRHLADVPGDLKLVSSTSVDRKTETGQIAIIGIGCRFPGAKSPEDFWWLLRNGIDAIREVPAERWDLGSFYDQDKTAPGKMNTCWGGFLDQIDRFDPLFFRISPYEAQRIDPQQRLLLEVVWEALENAGLAPHRLAGSQTGVFIGISGSDYSHIQFRDPSYIDAYAGTGNAHSIAANRLSYVLDLRGPSLAVDTACSSSLVAVHLASQSLRNGECDLALVGGVNLILSPEVTVAFSQARMLAADGRCKTFDADADGYVRSEGCGVVVLKRLSDTQRDGDTILAVLRGSAINQDGRSNGLTAPNGPAQELVIRQALRDADVAPDQISYVETHGTGTPLGDPIEFASLKNVLMHGRLQKQPCALGSVKTNIGHLEAAAGIAGLIKVVLSLQKREIPSHLHLKQLNPGISLDGTTFFIPTQQHHWPAAGTPRLAGVSSFGFGGTNAHVIVEEAPPKSTEVSKVERPLHMLTLSAQSEAALQVLAERFRVFLTTHPEIPAADVCFTANTGRSHFTHRVAVSGSSSTGLCDQLLAFKDGSRAHGVYKGRVQNKQKSKIVFLFTGQGSQYPGMGQLLYDTQPTFRAALDRCNEILLAYLDQPLLSVLYSGRGNSSLLHETAYTQPALFALEYALVEMWHAWGIEPAAVMGHSIGEFVAACVAGVLSLEDALKLVAERARLMQALPQQGEMAVVFAEHSQVAATLSRFDRRVEIAAVNGPQNTLISGEREALQEALLQLGTQGMTTHPVKASHAFHSSLMDPVLDSFEQAARQIHFKAPRLPFISTLTGQMLKPGEIPGANYWCRQTRETVQFSAGIQALTERGYELFLEIGPTSTLLDMGRECLTGGTGTWLPSLKPGKGDWQTLLGSVATLYTQGVDLDWMGFDRDYIRHRLALPTYPFERQRCWLEIEKDSTHSNWRSIYQGLNGKRRHPLLGLYSKPAHPLENHVWEMVLDKQHLPYLDDLRIQKVAVIPATLYIEMARAATLEAFEAEFHVLTEIELQEPLFLFKNDPVFLKTVIAHLADGQAMFFIHSYQGDTGDGSRAWTMHARGKIAYKLGKM